MSKHAIIGLSLAGLLGAVGCAAEPAEPTDGQEPVVAEVTDSTLAPNWQDPCTVVCTTNCTVHTGYCTQTCTYECNSGTVVVNRDVTP